MCFSVYVLAFLVFVVWCFRVGFRSLGSDSGQRRSYYAEVKFLLVVTLSYTIVVYFCFVMLYDRIVSAVYCSVNYIYIYIIL